MDSQEKLTILKNIKSLHFDPSKLEPLKQNLFRSAIELEIKVYVALSTLVFLKRSCSLDWKKASFPRYLSFFFIPGRLLFCICKYFCSECVEILYWVMKQRHFKLDLVVCLDV